MRCRPLLFFLLLSSPLLDAGPVLTVGAPERSLAFTGEEFAALPRTELVAAEPHSQAEHRYAGVLLREFLHRLDVPRGKDLRGARQQLAVLVRGADGYAVVFSAAELDEGFGNTPVLISDREDGVPWNERYGPLRLIVAGDRFAARWVRNVTSIELVTVGTVVPRPPKS